MNTTSRVSLLSKVDRAVTLFTCIWRYLFQILTMVQTILISLTLFDIPTKQMMKNTSKQVTATSFHIPFNSTIINLQQTNKIKILLPSLSSEKKKHRPKLAFKLNITPAAAETWDLKTVF
jgi:hypothetical protein